MVNGAAQQKHHTIVTKKQGLIYLWGHKAAAKSPQLGCKHRLHIRRHGLEKAFVMKKMSKKVLESWEIQCIRFSKTPENKSQIKS